MSNLLDYGIIICKMMATQMIFLGAQTDENHWKISLDCTVDVPSNPNEMFLTVPALLLLCEAGIVIQKNHSLRQESRLLLSNSLLEFLQSGAEWHGIHIITMRLQFLQYAPLHVPKHGEHNPVG